MRESKLGFSFLSDLHNDVAAAFGLRFKLPDYRITLYRDAFKNDLALVNGDPVWTLPMPARYLIASDGVIAYAEVKTSAFSSMFLQLSGGGCEVRPQQQLTNRLLFVVIPDASSASDVAQRRQELRAMHRLRGKSVATERLHVTLHHVGDFAGLPEGIVTKALAVASAISMRPFTVEFNGALSFRGRLGNLPFVLQGDEGIIGLLILQHRFGRAMENAGLGRANPHYTPHMTLLYGDRAVADEGVRPIGWAVHEFVLVHSLLGRSRYNVLARFPLRAQA
jgi:2'-5' RNA ligase